MIRYRWAFVGSQHDYCSSDIVNGGNEHHHQTPAPLSVFIPHVTRIARLMDFRYTTHSPVRVLIVHIHRLMHKITSIYFSDPKSTKEQSPSLNLSVNCQSTGFVWLLFHTMYTLASTTSLCI